MSPVRVAVLLFVVALLGGGGLVLWAVSDEPGRASAETASSKRDPGDSQEEPKANGDTERRLAELETRVRRLERTRALRVERPIAVGDGAEDESEDGDPNVIDNPVFEAAVRDVVDRVEGEQEQQQQERRVRRMRAWAADSANDLGEALSLDDAQRAKVKQLLTEHFERAIAARESQRNADGGGSARERFRAAREELDGKVDALLTPEQRRQAETLRENGEFPGSWGRRGRRRR